MNMNHKRGTDESFEDYKDRRTKVNKLLRKYLQRGKLLWCSSSVSEYKDEAGLTRYKTVVVQGTYRKPADATNYRRD